MHEIPLMDERSLMKTKELEPRHKPEERTASEQYRKNTACSGKFGMTAQNHETNKDKAGNEGQYTFGRIDNFVIYEAVHNRVTYLWISAPLARKILEE